MTKKPWERRLKDLSHLLKCCIDTYFDPELFRLNLNQFLQTARTVTLHDWLEDMGLLCVN